MTLPAIKPRSTNIDWKTIDALYLQGFLPEAIEAKTGVNSRTISVHVSRRGLNKLKKEEQSTGDTGAVGVKTRSKLANAAEKLADALGKPPKGLERLNLWADTLQKGVKAASALHGWDQTGSVAIIVAGDVAGRREDPAEPAIEVESTSETPESA